MSIGWTKLGRLYCPSNTERHPKLLTHAANPLPVRLAGDVYRVFYSGRDEHRRSSVGAVDIDIAKKVVVQEHAEPVFTHGDPSTYFRDGVSIGNCYSVDRTTYMLFMGWQAPIGSQWRGDIGRLVLTPNLELILDTDSPLLDLDDIDPLSFSYPCVVHCRDGLYRMWYGSTQSWTSENGEMIHVINYAVSSDGHVWKKKGLAIPYQVGIAQAFSRPTVIEDDQGFQMWFSYRSGLGEKYRIGYAKSTDGDKWHLELNNRPNLSVPELPWDSDMQAYPFVFDHGDERLMLYNGNSYGLSGFGLAKYRDTASDIEC